MQRLVFRLHLLIGSGLAATACTFNFELTSQRTALENQVMGSYRELEDDLVLMSSVRSNSQAPIAGLSASRHRAIDARQNQEFNRDDIDELKEKQILGEARDGTLSMLPTLAKEPQKPSAADLQLARLLVSEENRDRHEVWQRIIASNENLSSADINEVRKTYAKMQRDAARSGHWIQADDGRWQRKDGQTETDAL